MNDVPENNIVEILISFFLLGLIIFYLIKAELDIFSKKKNESKQLRYYTDMTLNEQSQKKVHKTLKDPVDRLKAKRRYDSKIYSDNIFNKKIISFRNIYEIDIYKIFYNFDIKIKADFVLIHPEHFETTFGGFNTPNIKGSVLINAIQNYYKIEESIALYLLKTWIENSLIYCNDEKSESIINREAYFTIGRVLYGSKDMNFSEYYTEIKYSFGSVFEIQYVKGISNMSENCINYIQWKILKTYRSYIINIFSESSFYELEKEQLVQSFLRKSVLSETIIDEYLKFWLNYGLIKKYIYAPKYRGRRAEKITYAISNIMKIY